MLLAVEVEVVAVAFQLILRFLEHQTMHPQIHEIDVFVRRASLCLKQEREQIDARHGRILTVRRNDWLVEKVGQYLQFSSQTLFLNLLEMPKLFEMTIRLFSENSSNYNLRKMVPWLELKL